MTTNIVSEVIRVWDRGASAEELEEYLTDDYLKNCEWTKGRRLAEKVATRFQNGEITLDEIAKKSQDDNASMFVRDVYDHVWAVATGSYEK